MPYLGNEPAVAYTSTTKDSFSGDGSTTAFTMSKSANVNAVRVVVENVIQDPTVAYTCSGTTLTFTSAPPSGINNIYVVHLGPPAATIAPPSTINNATTFTSNVTLKSEVPEDTDGGRGRGIDFQGTQSGGEVSKLAQILASHDGTADDEKGKISFKTNDGNDSNSPTERWLITSEGHFKAAANGYGIDFSATEGSGAATNGSILNDYEEGTWTPTFTNATITPYYTGGIYTKIGNMVYWKYYSGSSTISSASSYAIMGGLPYTISSDTANYGGITIAHNTWFGTTVGNGQQAYYALGGTSLYFVNMNTISNPGYVNGSTKYMMIAGYYVVA